MAPNGLSLYKRMILYMLRQTDRISNNRIVDFLLGGSYTDYFNAQEALSSLTADGSIAAETDKGGTVYSITEEGKTAADALSASLDFGIRTEIREYLKKNALAMRDETDIRADYYLDGPGRFLVTLSVREEEVPVLDLTLSVPDEEEAQKICRAFRKKAGPFYAAVLAMLTDEETEGEV